MLAARGTARSVQGQAMGKKTIPYGKIYPQFWDSFRGQDSDVMLLGAYLLTCHHRNMIGCYRLPITYAADDLEWEPTRVSNALGQLAAMGFATYCFRSRFVWVHKFLEFNPLENPNQRTGAWCKAEEIPQNCEFRPQFLELLSTITGMGETLSEPFPNPFETLSKPFTNPLPTLSKPGTGAVVGTGVGAGKGTATGSISSEPFEICEPEILEAPRSEPSGSSPPVIPVKGGKDFIPDDGFWAELQNAYPALELGKEFQAMRVWCLSNPSKQKTAKGVKRFINSWLSRAEKAAKPKRKTWLEETRDYMNEPDTDAEAFAFLEPKND